MAKVKSNTSVSTNNKRKRTDIEKPRDIKKLKKNEKVVETKTNSKDLKKNGKNLKNTKKNKTNEKKDKKQTEKANDTDKATKKRRNKPGTVSKRLSRKFAKDNVGKRDKRYAVPTTFVRKLFEYTCQGVFEDRDEYFNVSKSSVEFLKAFIMRFMRNNIHKASLARRISRKKTLMAEHVRAVFEMKKIWNGEQVPPYHLSIKQLRKANESNSELKQTQRLDASENTKNKKN
jgi:hypothetical protein